jgi:hypothetical protein
MKPHPDPIKGEFAIVICKEAGDMIAVPSLAQIVEVEPFEFNRLRWFKNPNSKGECVMDFYNATQSYGPAHHKILHCADNLVRKRTRQNSAARLTAAGMKWWKFAKTIIDAGLARI